jgi:G:T-mismatch repair DNA endonuclease (very short patch repair protein)
MSKLLLWCCCGDNDDAVGRCSQQGENFVVVWPCAARHSGDGLGRLGPAVRRPLDALRLGQRASEDEGLHVDDCTRLHALARWAGAPVAEAAGWRVTLSSDVIVREAVEAETRKLRWEGAVAFGCRFPRTASVATTLDSLETIGVDVGPSTR